MGSALRILQTGEFRLDEPILTGTQLPETLKTIALEARYQSTLQAIDTAISEKIDVLIIAGNAFEWSADRRPAWFLAEQFNRLDRHEIQVVWAELKESAFPAIVPLPSNVHKVTPQSRSVIHVAGRNLEFSWDWQNPPAPTPQSVDLQITLHRAGEANVRSIREVVYTSHKHEPHRIPVVSIQGKSAGDGGPHGAQFVSWNGTFETKFVSTETVRWVNESIEITPLSTRETLEAELRKRQLHWQQHSELQPQQITLCQWKISGSGPLWTELLARDFESFGRSLIEANSHVHHFWSTNVELLPDASQHLDWRKNNAVSVGMEELERHNEEHSNLIPESFQKPAWATQFKTSAIKKSVVPQLVSSLYSNSSP